MHNKVDAKSNGHFPLPLPCPTTPNGVHWITLFVDCPGCGPVVRSNNDWRHAVIQFSKRQCRIRLLFVHCRLDPDLTVQVTTRCILDQVKGSVHNMIHWQWIKRRNIQLPQQVAQMRLRCSNPSVAAVKYNDPTLPHVSVQSINRIWSERDVFVWNRPKQKWIKRQFVKFCIHTDR